MGKLTVLVSDEVEDTFRELVAKRYGLRRGALSIAVEEALKLWNAKVRSELQSFENIKATEEGEPMNSGDSRY